VDGDNDTATDSHTVDISGAVSFDDDVPTVDVSRVLESSLPTLTTQDAQTDGDPTGFDTASASFAGLFDLDSSMGADDDGTAPSLSYSLGVTNSVSGLTSDGLAINLYLVGTTIVGSTAGSLAGVTAENTIFSLAVESTGANAGTVTLTQYAEIDHLPEDVDATNDNFNLGLAAGKISLTATATIVDGDNDTATDSHTVDISGAVSFDDDVPITAPDAGVPISTTLAFTNYGMTSASYNNSFGYYIKDANGNPINGKVIWDNVKLFVNSNEILSGYTSDQLGYFIIPDGDRRNANLTSGTNVTFSQNTSGAWQAYADADSIPLFGVGANILFDIAALNLDGLVHTIDNQQLPGNLNWEDIYGGGDRDYNDVNIGVVSTVTYGGNVLDNDRMGADGLNPPVVTSVTFGNGSPVPVDGETTVEGDYGQLKLYPDGSYTYTYNPGKEGAEVFVYTVMDYDGDTSSTYLLITSDEVLRGDLGNNILVGGVGHDVLMGMEGNDDLSGGGGNDFLLGDAGNDVLVGGPDADTMTGGEGSDTFKYAVGDLDGSSVDHILDFHVGATGEGGDVLDFTGVLSGAISGTSGNLGDYLHFDNVDHHDDGTTTADLGVDANGGGDTFTHVASVTMTGVDASAGGADILTAMIQNDEIKIG
jgi:hypothetical protein